MLEIHHLSCGYGAFQAVGDLSLTLRPGTITGLIGANGAGKSSTLMCVAGHVALQAGAIMFDGQDISTLTPDRHVARTNLCVCDGRSATSAPRAARSRAMRTADGKE